MLRGITIVLGDNESLRRRISRLTGAGEVKSNARVVLSRNSGVISVFEIDEKTSF